MSNEIRNNYRNTFGPGYSALPNSEIAFVDKFMEVEPWTRHVIGYINGFCLGSLSFPSWNEAVFLFVQVSLQ